MVSRNNSNFAPGRPLEALDLKMRINDDLLSRIEADLCLNTPFVKGKKLPIRNCWHFYTDGSAVDVLFDSEQDFIVGMNRVYIASQSYEITILAFCLMDTHVHFILYGEYEQCNKFVHKFILLTSKYIQFHHGESKKLRNLPVNHQFIDNDFYLKVAICYVVKNPFVAGLPFNALDYPWSGNPLYFRRAGYWSSVNPPVAVQTGSFTKREQMFFLKSKMQLPENLAIANNIVHPSEYVAYEVVEKIFRTHKSFNWFMSISKEEDVEAKGGIISRLSIPIQELRQNLRKICKERFGVETTRTLSTQDRIKLAKLLRTRYNSSPKQITRACGLIYDEVKDMI